MDYAVLVGMNAYPYPNRLQGCINDVTDVKDELNHGLRFSGGKIVTLLDEEATASGIKKALSDAIGQLNSGDRFVFWYSGHGAQLVKGDAATDVICPIDFDFTEATSVTVDDFHNIFVKIPKGVEAAWGSDSCHSGDLEKELRLSGYPKLFRAEPRFIARLYASRPTHFTRMREVSEALPNIALIAGCQSDQTSADATFNGRYNGAFTYFFLKELRMADGLKKPLQGLVPRIQNDLQAAGYVQSPQLSGPPSVIAAPFLYKHDERSVDMDNGDVTELLRQLGDRHLQARALTAARKAMLAQLKNDGVELTPELVKDVAAYAMSARDPGDVLAGAAAVVLGIGISLSDSRLKEHVSHVGVSPSGINIYEFRYNDSADVWRGVMAQELLDRHPSVVLENRFGFLIVDYSKIDVRLEYVDSHA